MDLMIDKGFITGLKKLILHSRYTAATAVNKEILELYYNVGMKISNRIDEKPWGSKVLKEISKKLQDELPGLRGFSLSGLKRMKFFYETWNNYFLIGSLVPNQLGNTNESSISPSLLDEMNNISNTVIGPSLLDEFISHFFSVNFTCHSLIISNVKSIDEVIFYIKKTAVEFCTTRTLEHHIKSDLYNKLGKLPNNFIKILPDKTSNKAILSFKDEYLLDFVNIEDPDEEEDEKLIENEIVRNIKKFILTLGSDFAFIGNQFRLIVEDQTYFIDLLFFNRKLQALVAFELKKGKFKPEYLGKMNFYLSALDDLVKQPHENPSIGIILCKEKNNKIVEFSFRDYNKAMGVATYKTSSEIPKHLKDVLPDAETLKRLMD